MSGITEVTDANKVVKEPKSLGDKSRENYLKIKAAECRLNVVRMLAAGGHGHAGGAMSAIDIITALYFDEMNVDPKNPKMEGRDKFILSAGHKCMSQYAVLAEMGYFDKEILDTYGSLHSKIPGHPDMYKLPGIEANTGALGHGLAIGAGMAMAAKLEKTDARVYVMLGDGELAEGSNWEAAAAASKFNLDNLVVFLDHNGLQISGRTADVMDMSPIDGKFEAFGFNVITIDGNNMAEILDALDKAKRHKGGPTLVLAKTIKAKGITFGEDDAAYHFWNPTAEELDQVKMHLVHTIKKITSGGEDA